MKPEEFSIEALEAFVSLRPDIPVTEEMIAGACRHAALQLATAIAREKRFTVLAPARRVLALARIDAKLGALHEQRNALVAMSDSALHLLYLREQNKFSRRKKTVSRPIELARAAGMIVVAARMKVWRKEHWVKP